MAVAYMSPTGSDLNTGLSPAQAKATLSAAVVVAGVGGTVYAVAGSYAVGAYTILTAGVTLSGYGGVATFNVSALTHFLLFGDGWTLVDLSIVGGMTRAIGGAGTPRVATLRNVTITGSPIGVDNLDNGSMVDRCTFIGQTTKSVDFGTKTGTVRSSVFRSSSTTGITCDASGADLKSCTFYACSSATSHVARCATATDVLMVGCSSSTSGIRATTSYARCSVASTTPTGYFGGSTPANNYALAPSFRGAPSDLRLASASSTTLKSGGAAALYDDRNGDPFAASPSIGAYQYFASAGFGGGPSLNGGSFIILS